MEDMKISRHIQDKNKATHKSTIGTYTRTRDDFGVHKSSTPQPKR
jgi:hypothetical protein